MASHEHELIVRFVMKLSETVARTGNTARDAESGFVLVMFARLSLKASATIGRAAAWPWPTGNSEPEACAPVIGPTKRSRHEHASPCSLQRALTRTWRAGRFCGAAHQVKRGRGLPCGLR